MENLIGKKFNLLTIVGEAPPVWNGKSNVKYVYVQCDCGSPPRKTQLSPLKNGRTISCGCARATSAKKNRVCHVGKVFGKLTVISDCTREDDKRRYVMAQCDCGSEPFRVSYTHISGKVQHTKSCGCWYEESRGKATITHGMRNTPMYSVWAAMKARCTNPNDRSYQNYGGRGITVCEEWINSFQNFYNDMVDGYQDGVILDRIDNDGDYSKGNCRWTDMSVSNHNKRKRITGITSKYIGVSWNDDKSKWIAMLVKNRVAVLNSSFLDEYQAALAYDDMSEIYYGDRPNKTLKE